MWTSLKFEIRFICFGVLCFFFFFFHLFLFLMWLIKIFFNWRIISLQCCVGFCHTTWINHNYAYFPPILSLPLISPGPTPLGHHRAPGWTLFYTHSTRLEGEVVRLTFKIIIGVNTMIEGLFPVPKFCKRPSLKSQVLSCFNMSSDMNTSSISASTYFMDLLVFVFIFPREFLQQ